MIPPRRRIRDPCALYHSPSIGIKGELHLETQADIDRLIRFLTFARPLLPKRHRTVKSVDNEDEAD